MIPAPDNRHIIILGQFAGKQQGQQSPNHPDNSYSGPGKLLVYGLSG